jgi:hypothetical protein
VGQVVDVVQAGSRRLARRARVVGRPGPDGGGRREAVAAERHHHDAGVTGVARGDLARRRATDHRRATDGTLERCGQRGQVVVVGAEDDDGLRRPDGTSGGQRGRDGLHRRGAGVGRLGPTDAHPAGGDGGRGGLQLGHVDPSTAPTRRLSDKSPKSAIYTAKQFGRVPPRTELPHPHGHAGAAPAR